MQYRTITLVITALFAIGAIAQGKPPESFGAKGAAYVIGDDEVAPLPLPAHRSLRHRLGSDFRGLPRLRLRPSGLLPQSPRKITIPSNTRFYGGYYVGGGTPTRGAGRCIEDGTWGWDYAGVLFTKRISLNWTAKGRPQGGTGAYKTDGPKLRRE